MMLGALLVISQLELDDLIEIDSSVMSQSKQYLHTVTEFEA